MTVADFFTVAGIIVEYLSNWKQNLPKIVGNIAEKWAEFNEKILA